MTKPNAVIFIVANETYNAGERDYTKALVGQMQRQGLREDTDYLFYKVAPKGNVAPVSGDPRAKPATDAQYKEVPTIGAATLIDTRQAQSVTIVGAGHSTLNDVATLSSYFKETGKAVKASWVTHIPEAAIELKIIADHKIKTFGETTREAMAAMDPVLAAEIDFTHIDAVPNTNSEEFCRPHLARYLDTDPGMRVKAMVDSGQPFAFAVLNAGFEVGEPKIYTPYTVEEAAEHGFALGAYLPAGTALILAHGGPRNLRDEGGVRKLEDTHKAQHTTSAFVNAYEAMQFMKGDAEPKVFVERYAPDMTYDAIKCGYLLSRADNCLAFISNDEGFGTKSAACGHVDNAKKLLGAFPFAAEYADVTEQRQNSIEKWHKKGIAKLSKHAGQLVVTRHPEEMKSAPAADSAPIIIEALGLAKPRVPQPIKAPKPA